MYDGHLDSVIIFYQSRILRGQNRIDVDALLVIGHIDEFRPQIHNPHDAIIDMMVFGIPIQLKAQAKQNAIKNTLRHNVHI